MIVSNPKAMAGTILLTGANSSLAIPAVEHLLSSYPDHTAILTVRNASNDDPNTNKLREVVASFPGAKATIHALDLSSLAAVHEFVDTVISGVSNGNYPPLVAIIANACYWNLVGDPEITADGFDKTIQVSHISHAALILRLIGSFGKQDGRIVLLSSDSHWPGKNSMEKYPPIISPNNMNDLIDPTADEDKQGRGFQRYATAKLAITTWLYPLNQRLQKDPKHSSICAIAINPGNLVDSRCLTHNTPISLHRMQRFVFKPLLPLLRLMIGNTFRTATPAGIDLIDLAIGSNFQGKRGFYTLLEEDVSSPDSHDETKQERLWEKTLEWAKITRGNTALRGAF